MFEEAIDFVNGRNGKIELASHIPIYAQSTKQSFSFSSREEHSWSICDIILLQSPCYTLMNLKLQTIIFCVFLYKKNCYF